MIVFIGLTYVLAWGWWIPLAWSGVVVHAGQGWPSHLPALLAPAIAALVVTGMSSGRAGLAALASRAVAWRLSGPTARPVLVLLALTSACAFLPLLESPRPPLAAFVAYSGAPQIGPVVVVYVALVNGLGEELGWRGYLVEHLLPRLGALRATLVTWVIWATWHAPLFVVVDSFRDLGPVGTIGWMIGIGCGSLVLTWLYVASSRSVLIPAVWHTAYNFATATAAASALSSGLASALIVGVCAGLIRHRRFWAASTPRPDRR